jgi:hypothetical protein
MATVDSPEQPAMVPAASNNNKNEAVPNILSLLETQIRRKKRLQAD